MIGPIPSTPTVWRALSEVGELQLTRLNAAVTSFRRHWWGLLAARPEGFPWLTVTALTTSPCSTWRCRGCRAATGAGC